jgi:hypothetical protein
MFYFREEGMVTSLEILNKLTEIGKKIKKTISTLKQDQ